MAPRRFRTIPDELVELAEAVAASMRGRGHTVRIERLELGYPATPAMVCHRRPTTTIIEVDTAVRWPRLEPWLAYGRSIGRDTRIVLCVPGGTAIQAADEDRFRKEGLGLVIAGATLVERLVPRDLSLNVSLPSLASEGQRLRQTLGPAYEKFESGDWREGFRLASKALEIEARRHLRQGVRSTRIIVLDAKGQPRRLTVRDVDRMTAGQLATALANVASPKPVDSDVSTVLTAVNPDRINLVHYAGRGEARLRRDVGRHMWQVVAALKRLFE